MIRNFKICELDKKKISEIKLDPETQKNDFFDYSKAVVKKPWGHEYLIYENGLASVWILYIKKGYKTSMHSHPNKKTSLVVLLGEALCSTLESEFKIKAGEGLLIDKSVFHSTKANSEGGIFVMEIETPINKRDLARLDDNYGRVGKGYETVENMSFNLHNYNYISLIDSDVFYNVKKKFGKCSISLKRFKNCKEYRENFKLEGWDAISILKGKILDDNKNTILDVGDTIDLKTIKSCKETQIEDGVEMIIIKKIDNMVKISDYIVSFFEQNNIRNIFLVPGSTNVHLLDSVGRNTNINHIKTHTESAASMAAEAYAKLTGEIGVLIIAAGTAGVNTLTGIADAWVDSTPLLVISGQSQSTFSNEKIVRQLGIQELNIKEIVKPITKYSVSVDDPHRIRYHLEKAIFLAKEGRPGPVWLDIPIDIQGMNIDEEELCKFHDLALTKSSESQDSLDDEIKNKISEGFKALEKSRRPVILVGNGVRLAGAEKHFRELVELLGIPILTSKRGADLMDDSHRLFFGRPGAYGQRHANFILQNSDLIISIGSRLSIPLIGRNYEAFGREAKIIVVDIDRNELTKNTIKPDIAINTSSKDFLIEMIKMCENYNVGKIGGWLKKCIGIRNNLKDIDKRPKKKDCVNAYLFIEALSRKLNGGEIITIDSGSPVIFAMQSFIFKKCQRMISATGLENTNFAIPASIGSYLGSNGKEIIALCEGPGFQSHVQEIETIVRNKMPIKICILNSGGHSYIKQTQKEYFGGRYVAFNKKEEGNSPSFVEIAKAYGIKTYKISNEDCLEENIGEILSAKGPLICEINIDKDQQIIPRITFSVKPDGKWIAKPLEEMYPFLERKIFKENMVVDALDEE